MNLNMLLDMLVLISEFFVVGPCDEPSSEGFVGLNALAFFFVGLEVSGLVGICWFE